MLIGWCFLDSLVFFFTLLTPYFLGKTLPPFPPVMILFGTEHVELGGLESQFCSWRQYSSFFLLFLTPLNWSFCSWYYTLEFQGCCCYLITMNVDRNFGEGLVEGYEGDGGVLVSRPFHEKDSQKLIKWWGHRLRSSVIKHGPELWRKLFSLPLHRSWYYIDIPKVEISMASSWALLFSSWVVPEILFKEYFFGTKGREEWVGSHVVTIPDSPICMHQKDTP